MRSVAVTGVSGPVGQRLLGVLARTGVERIVGIDRVPSQVRNRVLETVTADLATADLKSLFDGVDTVIHLAWAVASEREAALLGRANIEGTRRVLEAAGTAGADTLVHLSSATVYGAWADNPVPLTEQAPVRPNPGFVDAAQRAEAERLVADWAAEHPSAAAAVLRPVPVMGPGIDGWLTRALGGGAPVRVRDTNPPRQFVHVDDLATAIALAATERLDGPYNVTPDGWIPGEVAGDLAAGRPPVAVPARIAAEVASWLWALRLSDTPPSLLPLVVHPWVVANDRLRAAGWEPRYSNEEALVAGRPGSPWREMSPRRRQELAFAATGVALVAAAGGAAALIRRVRRSRP